MDRTCNKKRRYVDIAHYFEEKFKQEASINIAKNDNIRIEKPVFLKKCFEAKML